MESRANGWRNACESLERNNPSGFPRKPKCLHEDVHVNGLTVAVTSDALFVKQRVHDPCRASRGYGIGLHAKPNPPEDLPLGNPHPERLAVAGSTTRRHFKRPFSRR
jgi:hypothetical protein